MCVAHLYIRHGVYINRMFTNNRHSTLLNCLGDILMPIHTDAFTRNKYTTGFNSAAIFDKWRGHENRRIPGEAYNFRWGQSLQMVCERFGHEKSPLGSQPYAAQSVSKFSVDFHSGMHS